MTPFDIKRIEEMEALYDALLQAVAEIEQGCAAEAAARKAAWLPEIDRLAAYYSSEACAEGRLLLIEPDKSLSEQPEIAEQVVAKAGEIPHDCLRYKFLALNAIAEQISKYQPQ